MIGYFQRRRTNQLLRDQVSLMQTGKTPEQLRNEEGARRAAEPVRPAPRRDVVRTVVIFCIMLAAISILYWLSHR